MNREQMAWQLYLRNYETPPERGGYYVSPKRAFKAADHFLAYADKERKKEKPILRHTWPGGGKPCMTCGWYSDESPEQKCFGRKDGNVAPATTSQEPVKKSAECEHEWEVVEEDDSRPWSPSYCTRCSKCGAPKVKDPTYNKALNALNEGVTVKTVKVTEQRKPREVWVCFRNDGSPAYAWNSQDEYGSRRLFREILPGEKE